MKCPHCQRELPDPNVATCPFCGMPVNTAAEAETPTVLQEAPTVVQGTPGGASARPEWNDSSADTVAYTPPSDQPPAYTPPPPVAPPAPPQEPPPYTPPAYTPPVYNQPPQQPVYQPPQQPAYGATEPAMQPTYQQGYPATPAQAWVGQPQTPPQPKKRNVAGCVVGCLVALLLVVALGAGGAIYLNNQPGGVTIGSVTIGGSSTGPGGGALIYQNSMDGSSKDGWTSDSNCFFGSGGYHINAAFICYAPAKNVSDGVTTVSVKQTSGPITYGYGLIIRRPSKGNYYGFLIDGNGKWNFVKVVNGTPTDIVKFTASPAIKTGLNQSNTLSVTAKGSHFVFVVNGTQVGAADDTTFTSGDTGLSGNDGVEVVFSGLSIANVKS